MGSRLQGKRVFVVANGAAEQVELTEPWEAVRSEGVTPMLLALDQATVQAVNHDIEKGNVAAICRTDIANAGGRWVDERIFVWRRQGFALVTSRKPDGRATFGAALIDTFR